ncbi:hypothetical protein BDZ85DRAFT_60408 [Elsinoe ampelina]|uniref:Uncharacterized protein n=1 Tax=Elsinoe ampelina TaxID=302913 RepID=A0A6A6G075_9PEZI|nr:hypothetical protein BDZ85DRAFT_60408 [Elsinoe ampelina]
MMRRKFSFNFRETFGSGKSDGKGSKDGQSYSDEYSPPPSPHPGRRDPLPARTEVDLRLACAGIVNNTIPSDAYVEHENPYEQLGFPQLDYTAVRSKSEAARQRSMSGSKHTRNFSNPAANNNLPEFPVPNGPLDRSKYAYKPDTALKDLFVDSDRSHFTSLADRSRRRAESTTSLDKGATQKAPTGRQASRSFSVASNLPMNQLPVRPKQVRQLPVNHATASASGTFTGKRAKYASYHAPARVDPEIAALKEEDRGRQRKSWYKPFAGGADEGQGQERRESRSRSRARSITRGIQEYIRPGSTRGSSRRGSRARSSDSRRSSASSGVMPGGKNVFSWKNWRQSWNSWRESGDFEQDDRRLSNRRSGASLRNRNTLNLNRELPPLPSIDQWQGEDSPSLTQQALERTEDQASEKPKHIAALWNKSAAKRRSADLKKSAAELKKEFRKSMGPPSKQKQPDVQRKADFRKSYSDFDYTHPRIPVHQFESPILPHVMATMAPPPMPIITKAQRKPLPLSKSTPTDSLMDGQEVPVSPPPALDPEEIGIAKSTPELTLVIPPPPVTAPPPVPVEAVPSGPPSAESPPSDPITSVTTTSITDLQTKRKSGNYSWLPVEQEHKDVTPISRSQSVSLKRRSGNYSWLPAESGMAPNLDHRASLALKRRSGNYSWVPSESRDSSPAGGRMSMSQKRRSGNYAWTPTEGGETSISEKRRSRGDMISPIVVPSAVPKRFLEKRQDPITGETEFISRMSSLSSQGSAEFFNSLKTPKYQYADDISSLGTPSPAPSEKEGKKFKWKLGKKRSTTWMDEMEKLGIKDGVLLQDQLNGAPIVRY